MGRKLDICLLASAALASLLVAPPTFAVTFNIPDGSLAAALDAYSISPVLKSLSPARPCKVSGQKAFPGTCLRILHCPEYIWNRIYDASRWSSIAIVRAASERSENSQDELTSIKLRRQRHPQPLLKQ